MVFIFRHLENIPPQIICIERLNFQIYACINKMEYIEKVAVDYFIANVPTFLIAEIIPNYLAIAVNTFSNSFFVMTQNYSKSCRYTM